MTNCGSVRRVTKSQKDGEDYSKTEEVLGKLWPKLCDVKEKRELKQNSIKNDSNAKKKKKKKSSVHN